MKLLFSTMLYALGKELGLEGAEAEWNRQCADPDTNSLPAARMLSRVLAACAQGLGSSQLIVSPNPAPAAVDVSMFVDVAATHIGKARSRTFHVASDQNVDLWFSCDDDVEASQTTVLDLLVAADTPTPRIVFLPCYLRERDIVGVEFADGARTRYGLAPIKGAATCCFVANGAAIRRVAENCQHLKYRDDDGVDRLAVFYEQFMHGVGGPAQWWGEDLSFCHRATLAGVELVALVHGLSKHGDKMLKLDELQSTLAVEQVQ